MCTRNYLVTNNVLICVLGIFLAINVIMALQTPNHKTNIVNSHYHQFHLTNKHLMHYTSKTTRDKETINRGPSKRFDQYLTMARDVLKDRASYFKAIRSPPTKEETTLVPVVDHFAGIKTWPVPYNDVRKDTSNIQSPANDKQTLQDQQLTLKSFPSEGATTQSAIKTLLSKGELFDRAYKESREIDVFASDEDMMKQSVSKPKYGIIADIDVARDTGFYHNVNKMVDSVRHGNNEDSNLLNNQMLDFDNLGTSVNSIFLRDVFSEEELNMLLNTRYLLNTLNEEKTGTRRDYKDFGTFQSYNDGDPWSDSELMGFTGGASFGKFSPDQSVDHSPFSGFTSDESRWGQAKNRDLGSHFFKSDIQGAFRPIGTFQSEGFFSKDEGDCEDIDTRSCSTNVDCSCYGLYQCNDGVCSSKTPIRSITASDSSRDVKESEFWHSGPYRDEELGVNN